MIDTALVAGPATSVSGTRVQVRRVVLFTAFGLLVVAVGPYLLPAYTVNILIRAFLYAAVALTVDILWGYTGILTFGQSAFFGIGAYAAGLMFTHAGFSPGYAAVALVAGVVGAIAVALIVGWLSFYHGASPLYASVVSLVLPIVATQVVFSAGTFTGSSSGLSGFESFDIAVETWFWITGAGLVVLTATAWLFVRSDAARILVAIRENEQRCEYLGIDTSRVKILLLVVCATVAAIAGYAYAGYTMVVAPELTGFVFGTELVIWVALGGRGTLIGPVIGTLLIDVSSAYLSGELPFVWKLLIGLAFVLVIVALPQGLMPVVGGLWRRLVGRGTVMRAAPAPALQVTERGVTVGPLGGSTWAIELKDVRKHWKSVV